ncbi:MAG TPA: phosphoglucomutase, partial [Cytophagales bacterium]|nr:phosphoglucomutase [Cytophagales bacterium]
AVSSCAFIAEMAAYYKDKGKSLYEVLQEVYVKHGFYKEKLISITKKGKSGADEIKQMMKDLRANPPKKLGGARLVKLMDYEMQTETDLLNGSKKPIHLPKSDVLQFVMEDGSKASARPSGTEPKIKFYFSVKEHLASASQYEAVSKKCDEKIEQTIKDLGF